MKNLLLLAAVLLLLGVPPAGAAPVAGLLAPIDSTYQILPFSQNWSNTGLITANDDWSGVPGIVGYRGDNLTTLIGVDPQTLLADDTPRVIDVNANQTTPDTFITGGAAEFHLADPVVALTGSGTADAPYLLLHLNTTGFQSISVAYNLRDIDGSTDDAVQPVALQYRVGNTGAFTNVPAAYVADATTGPNLATTVTPVNITLPAAADNQAQVQLRIITTNAAGNDEWVGIDDISVTGTPTAIDPAPAVTDTTPANGESSVLTTASIAVNFSEAVDLTAGAVTLECPAGTPVAFTGLPAGSVSSITLTPSASLPDDTTCAVTVVANEVADSDADDPPDNMAANYGFTFTTIAADVCAQSFTPIYQIQGSGNAAAITGPVTTQGVVVGDYELPGGTSQIRGFYLQDATGDSDAATSDGIFVFNNGADTVTVGQVVRLSGTAEEYQDQTQISSPTIIQCGTTGSVTPVDVTLPLSSADALERFEGMLVRFPQTLYVTEHFQLGRFGQIVMTSSSDRLSQPTNVVAPGAPALALQAANNLDRIIVDDEINNQNPDPILFGRGGNPLSAANTLRGGDSATGIVGVLAYGWAGNSASPNAYRLRPVAALGGAVPNFQATNPRPAAPSAVGGRLRVASTNLLNYFNTFDGLPDAVDNCTNGAGGAATDCRGADTSTEFDRQWPKTVANLVGAGADVIGIMEMENDGYDPASAIQDLVTKLNSATAPGTYAFIDADARTGQTNALGTDAIKVGLIYKPAKVTPVGTTAALNSVAFVNGGDGAQRNRPALAQTFEEVTTGEKFTVVVNHLKSKGSACDAPDAGDGQGECSVVRVNAAQALTAWLATDPTGTGDPDTLILGDLNSYAKEDPITVIKNAGYTNLIESLLGANAYSYAFDGQWGYLDHAMSSETLTPQVTGVTEWHLNADEPSVLDYNTDFKSAGQISSLYANDPYRSTDHDPAIIGLDLTITNDLSDLPASYGAAWHTFSELQLGDTWAPGHSTVDGGTNDGVKPTPGFAWLPNGTGRVAKVDVAVAGAQGYVAGWIDWNMDGDFGDSGELVFQNEAFLTAGEPRTITFPIPDGVTTGSRTFSARFRVYPTAQIPESQAGPAAPNAAPSPEGGATGGEVEDYTWSFSPNAVTLHDLRAVGLPTAGLALAALGLLLVGLLFRRQRHAVG